MQKYIKICDIIKLTYDVTQYWHTKNLKVLEEYCKDDTEDESRRYVKTVTQSKDKDSLFINQNKNPIPYPKTNGNIFKTC